MPGTHVLYRRPPWRLRAQAALAALVVHVALLWVLFRPGDPTGEAIVPIAFVTELEEIPPAMSAPAPDLAVELAEPEGTLVSDATSASSPEAGPVEASVTRSLAAAIPFLPESASRSLPLTAFTEARGAPLPLVVRPGGGIGRRRLERTPEQITKARAESLLFAQMADIAVAERRDIGAVGLANGGVTLAIPWSGFLPADRRDGEWRKKRCSGNDDGDSDKAGEGEARRAGCR